MAELIHCALSNFTLTLLVIGLIVSAIALLHQPRPWPPHAVAEALLAYFVLFSIGVSLSSTIT